MGTKSYPVIDLVATGANIIRLRKERGYSVTDLQEFFWFESPQEIYKWQQGKTLPSTDNLFALSQFLEVTIEEILVAEKPKFQVLPQDESCGSFFMPSDLKLYRDSTFAGLFPWLRPLTIKAQHGGFNHGFNDRTGRVRYNTPGS